MNYEEYKKLKENNFGIDYFKKEPENEFGITLPFQDAFKSMYFPDGDDDNEELVWHLIGTYPDVIKHASVRFREDLSLAVLGLIKSLGRSYQYLSPKFKNNPGLALCAFKFDWTQIEHIPNALFDYDFCQQLLKQLNTYTHKGLVKIPEAIISSPEVLINKIIEIEEKVSPTILTSSEFKKVQEMIREKY